MLNVTNLSTLKTCYHCHCLYHCRCHSFATVPPTTSPCSSATKSRGLPYNCVIDWCGAISTNRKGCSIGCFCLQPLPDCRHFREKSPFWPFLPAPNTKQTWWQCLRKSMADIIYHKSGFTWFTEALSCCCVMLTWSVDSRDGAWGWALQWTCVVCMQDTAVNHFFIITTSMMTELNNLLMTLTSHNCNTAHVIFLIY